MRRLPVLITLLILIVYACRPVSALELFQFDFPLTFRETREEPIEIESLEQFVDNFFPRELERLNIPGAVFSFVQDGKLVFSKGYGYADLANKTPIDPEKTLFRVASISKVVTATAAMQLYEQGLLNLHEDVNTYLNGFQLPETFDKPVTVAHLLTHTGGFDDRSINLASPREDQVPSMQDYLARNIPPRVMPPGEIMSYSNHGSGLAGLIIENISCTPFIDYAHENVLEPLGMERSSFLLPPELAPDLATGYFNAGGYNQPRAFDYLYNIAPAASLNSTAEDMARFAIAHLQGGKLAGTRILQEATLEEMQSQQFTHHPDLSGSTYGFFERFANDRRFIHHSGLWGGFASLLFLYPEGNLGFFVSLNSGAGVEVHGNLAVEFVDNFLPTLEEGDENESAAANAAVKQAAETETFESQVDVCIGSFRPVRYSRHSLEKIAVLAAQCDTTDLGDGNMALNFTAGSGRESILWAESEPFFFRHSQGEDGLAFRQDADGQVTHMFWGPVAMERLTWYENTSLHRAAGIAFLVVFFSAWVGWPVLWALRRRGIGLDSYGWQGRLPALAAAMLNTVFLITYLAYVTNRPEPFIYGVPTFVLVVLALPLAAAALTVGSIWIGTKAWLKSYWSLPERLHYSLVVLSLALFIPFLHYWNLLGYRL